MDQWQAAYASGLQGVIDAFDEAVEVLVAEAHELNAAFWKEVKREGKFCPYIIRIRGDRGSYQVTWGKMVSYKDEDDNQKSFVEWIPKGTSSTYKRSSFKNAPDWFWPLFDTYEPQLARLREEIKKNRVARGKILTHKRRIEKEL